MEVRRIQSLFTTFLIGALLLSFNAAGGVVDDLPSSRQAMEFIESEIPELHTEIRVVLERMPEMVEAINETVSQIHADYLRFSEMSPELANLFLTIKKREFKNQIMAEKIQSLTDPNKRTAEFKRLAAHMNVTFDLHLRLVKGELAWLEREVEGLKGLVASEQENKARYLREDLVSLLLENDPLLRISISGLGEKQTEQQQAAVRKLIDGLPAGKPANAPPNR